MGGRKSGKKLKNATTTSTFVDIDSPGNSTFFNGLGVSSSPAETVFCYDALTERKKLTVETIESEVELAKTNVADVLNSVAEEIFNTNCNFIVDPLCNEDDSLYDVISKVFLEAKENRSAASRKVTSSSNPGLSMQPPSTKKPLRRSRSVESHSKTSSMNKTRRLSGGPSNNFSCFKTPMGTRNFFNFNIATVTPNPHMLNSTAGILRKPKPGEQAISMSGSPLLVASDYVSSPSVTVPLADGRVFNVMGSSCPMKEHLRHGLDVRTKERLRELKHLLSDLVPE